MATKKRYLFPADYMADPSVHIFNDRVYIYPSHDWECENVENDNGDQYVMKDYHVLSTDDPMNGEVIDHGCALKLEDIPWAGRQMWDNDCQEKDGKYYMYFPLKDKCDIFRIGVAVADCPEGPFIPQPDPIRGSYSMYFGGLWGGQLQRYKDNKALESAYLPEGEEPALPSRVVKLTDDMLQWAEEPKPVYVVDEEGNPLKANDPHRFFEASWVHKHNGKYYFSYSTGDSHLLCYAIGDNPYGPFTYKGVILTPVVGWTTHHDSVPSGGKSWLRSLKVCELTYNEDGTIQTIEGIDE